MYCHIHHCHYHHCNCVPKDNKENGKALTQEELLAYTQEMKEELKDYTVDLKDQIFSYIDIGVNPVEIANTFASLKGQDTYILKTLTNKIDELNNTTNLSMFNLRTRVTDLEGQSATIIQDLATSNVELNKVKLDTGITVTAKYALQVLRNQSEKNAEVVSYLDFKSEAISDSNALRNALNSGASEVYIPAGTVINLGDDRVNITNSSLQRVYGSGTIVFGEYGRLTFISTPIEIPIPTTTVSLKNQITFPDTSSISDDDVVIFWNPTDSSLSSNRIDYRDGFMSKVAKVRDTGVIDFYGMSPKINESALRCFVIKKAPFSLEGIKIETNFVLPTTGNRPTLMIVEGKTSVNVQSISSDSIETYVSLKISRCFDITIDKVNMNASNAVAYPFIISNCQRYTISNCHLTSVRHCFALGGDGLDGSVPTRDGVIVNCTLANNPYDDDTTVGVGAADAHGNVINTTYLNCVINSGAQFGGRDTTFAYCDIYSMGNPQRVMTVRGGECIGGTFNVVHCNLYINRLSSSGESRQGVVGIQCHNRTEPLVLNMLNNTVYWQGEAEGLNSLFSLTFIDDSSTSEPITVNIKDNTFMGNRVAGDFGEYLHYFKDSGDINAVPAKITISGNSNMPIARYVGARDTGPKNPTLFKYNILGESGRTSIPIPATGSKVGDEVEVTFKTAFPRNAMVTADTYENYTNGTLGWLVRTRGYTTKLGMKGICLDPAGSILGSPATYGVQWSASLLEF